MYYSTISHTVRFVEDVLFYVSALWNMYYSTISHTVRFVEYVLFYD